MQEKFRRRRLPHWDLPGATYFVTACLAGSIPAEGLLDLSEYRSSLAKRPKPDHISEDDWKTTCWKQTFARWDHWLDQRPGVRHLADAALAKIVVDSFYFFAGERYDLLAYVVMPSHIHWVFTPRQEWAEQLPDDRSPREAIMHSLKLYTALKCNRRSGFVAGEMAVFIGTRSNAARHRARPAVTASVIFVQQVRNLLHVEQVSNLLARHGLSIAVWQTRLN
jgi:hypothetical protein